MVDLEGECILVDLDDPKLKIKITGRIKASSRIYGLFVAPIKNIFFFTPTPSISVRSWLITLSDAPPASPWLEPLETAIESNSSKKSTQGDAALALSKTSLTLA